MMGKSIHFATLAVVAWGMGTMPLEAQTTKRSTNLDDGAETVKPVVKPKIPSRHDYPDAGQAFGMAWHYNGDNEAPVVEFKTLETDNRLWTMACKTLPDGSVRVANIISATPKELFAKDRFGFTVRVDDGRSIGVLARMLPADMEGKTYHMPQFYLPASHDLLAALAGGSRAFVNLNGNKFSVHLNGSGEALGNFLTACQ
ncbi:hypothetical protein AB1K62_08945 [Parasphingorhabdus sp. JC815]|uniref:hypothetical protein n=1 Tax=Parasphingorhabdus sp. JC815 TaxID=3232140 RepID=UPI003458CADA